MGLWSLVCILLGILIAVWAGRDHLQRPINTNDTSNTQPPLGLATETQDGDVVESTGDSLWSLWSLWQGSRKVKQNMWIRLFSPETGVQIKQAEALMLHVALTPFAAAAVYYGGLSLSTVYTGYALVMNVHQSLADPYTVSGGVRMAWSQVTRQLAALSPPSRTGTPSLGDAGILALSTSPKAASNTFHSTNAGAMEFGPLVLQ